VSLKKPTEFFGKNNNQKEEITTSLPENLGEYKSNLKNIEVLNDFVSSFGTLKENIQKIDDLEEVVHFLKEELENLIKKEELDNAMMSNLLVLEKNIQKIELNLKGINRKDLNKIEEEIAEIGNKVSYALEEEFPKYKKSLKSNEIFIKDRFYEYSTQVDEKLNQFNDFIDSSFENIEKNLQFINDNQLLEITETVLSASQEVTNQNQLIEELTFRTKNQIFGIENEIKEFYSKVQNTFDSYQQSQENKITLLENRISLFGEEEVPKYQNLLKETKIQNEKKLQKFENNLTEKYHQLTKNIENQSDTLEKTLHNKLNELEISTSDSQRTLEETSNDYKKLIKSVEAKSLLENQKFEKHEKSISNLSNLFKHLEDNLDIIQENYSKKEDNSKEIESLRNQFIKKLNLLENDISFKENEVKKVSQKLTEKVEIISSQIQELNVKDLKEKYTHLTNKISYVEEVFSKFNEKTILNEGLLNQPSNIKSNDPLTPLDQKFVTLDQLQQHYRLFINRIQQQISTIGGGGAGFIFDLADVDFDTTTGDNKLLIYNQSTSKWVGIASTAITGSGGSGIGTQWVSTTTGIHTLSNVGIGITADANYKLYVQGDAFVTGNVSVAGTITYDDVTNVDSIGVITARQDVIIQRNLFVSGITTLGASNGIGTVTIGIGNTALLVQGNARVTGILSIGQGTVTIDGNNNTITSGQVTISGSSITLGDNVVINATASGINSAPNVLYVAKDGNNDNNGTSIDNAKLTIAGAVSIAQSGTTIKILSGTYIENNPIILPEQVSVVGDSLREVTITPSNSGDIFYVTNGNYVSNVSFVGAANTGAVIAFNPSGSGNITQSPYIQNCTNFIPNSVGVRVNGAHASGDTKSIVVDSYTQYNQGGIGVSITNNGYAQLVSLFTICNDIAIYCGSGGACDLTNSNSSFGNYGLVADGVSNEQYVGVITTPATANSSTFVVAGVGTNRPFDGQIVYFDDLYYEINKITITNGGSNYTSAPTLTIDEPTTDWGIAAQAVTTVSNGVVTEIDIISSGRGYTTTPSITIAGGGGSGLILSLKTIPKYYAIQSATQPSAGISTITINENLPYAVGVGTTVPFFKQSRILASGHSFEYIGSGVTIATALPSTGGVPIQENEIDMRNGALVIYTSTDQSGNFKIGDGVTINQTTGDISGTSYTRSLYANVTPLILALGA